jgi:predicted Rossmann fold nucleotide-binding protein DprA/Smf involved in DNA uptake
VDHIAVRARLDAGLLLAALSSLEIQGLIRQLPGKHFALAS